MKITQLEAQPAQARKYIYTDPDLTVADLEQDLAHKRWFRGLSEVRYFGPVRDADPEAPEMECALVWVEEVA